MAENVVFKVVIFCRCMSTCCCCLILQYLLKYLLKGGINMLTMKDYELLNEVTKDNSTAEYVFRRFRDEHRFIATRTIHELRNWLACIRSSLQLLEDDYPETSDSNYMQYIKQDMMVVCDRLTEFERLYDCMEEELKKGNLLELIQSVVQEVNMEYEKQGVLLSVSYDKKSECYASECCFDELRMRQVMRKLLQEALNGFKPGNQIKVSLTISSEKSKKGKCVHVKVSDSGEFIHEEDIQNIFEPYYSTGEDNTGVGFSFMKITLLRHGGDVIANCDNEESYIEFYLPITA